jgi:predicted acylesterase/phospholipase RssA
MRKLNGIAFNGGGANGLISSHIIAEIEKLTGSKIKDSFDFIAGTSTGALQTALLVSGYSGEDIVYIFTKEIPKIFDKEFLRYGIFRSKYDNSYLKDAVNHYTNGIRLGELDTKIIIPAYNASKSESKLFKSTNVDDKNFLLSDVVIASASAPTYFDAHRIGNDYYEDGGLRYNNPADLVLQEMQASILGCNYNGREFNILSCTTGFRTAKTRIEKVRKGIAGRGKATFENVLREQDLKVHDNLSHIYKYNIVNGTYTRIESVKDNSALKIDDGSCKNIKAMLKDGELTVAKNRDKLQDFINKTIDQA